MQSMLAASARILHTMYSRPVVPTRRATPANGQAVYATLRERLGNADYASGDRLTEQAIAEELGVSRTPVREALGRLLADGLVVRATRGVAVAALDDTEHDDLFALRAALESFAAGQAAERQSAGYLAPVVLNRMDTAADEVSAAAASGDGRAAAKANIRLHREIAAAAGNQFLLDALTRVWDRIAVATVSNLDDEEWLKAVPAQHSAVTDAIRRGDAPVARDAMNHHICAAASHTTRHGKTVESVRP